MPSPPDPPLADRSLRPPEPAVVVAGRLGCAAGRSSVGVVVEVEVDV